MTLPLLTLLLRYLGMEIHKQTCLASLSVFGTHIFPSSVEQSKEVVQVDRVVIEKDLDT